MTAALAIARRELMSYLLSPVGYVIAALFLFLTALVFFLITPLLVGSGFSQGQPASLRMFFEVAVWVLFLIAPALSMRTISEEIRMGTLESLMTSPVTETQIIAGKFVGAFSFLVIMLIPTGIFVLALELYGRPDYGEVSCGYLGLLLVGGAFIATGILASSITSSQVLAYVTTVFFWIILLLATAALPYVASLVEGLIGRPENSASLDWALRTSQRAADFLAVGNPLTRARGFIIGLVDSFNVVYFVSFIVVFLISAVRALGMRRWP